MSRWNIIENIATEIDIKISSALALSRNIEESHFAVLSITQYLLVPIFESADVTALHISINRGRGESSFMSDIDHVLD